MHWVFFGTSAKPLKMFNNQAHTYQAICSYYTRAVSATLVALIWSYSIQSPFFFTFKALHRLAAAYLSFTSRLIASSPLAATAVSHSRLLSVGGRSFSPMTYPNRSVTALLLLLSRPGLKHFPFTQCYFFFLSYFVLRTLQSNSKYKKGAIQRTERIIQHYF